MLRNTIITLLLFAVLVTSAPLLAGQVKGALGASATVNINLTIYPQAWQSTHDIQAVADIATLGSCIKHGRNVHRREFAGFVATCLSANSHDMDTMKDDRRVEIFIAAI